jgi:uncharacterized membrane protein
MESFLFLFVVGLIVTVITAISQSSQAKRDVQSFEERLRELQARFREQHEALLRRIHGLERRWQSQGDGRPAVDVPAPEPTKEPAELASIPEEVQPGAEPILAMETEAPVAAESSVAAAPPPLPATAPVGVHLPPPLPVAPAPVPRAAFEESRAAQAPKAESPPVVAKPAFTLEQFMGVKLFAWVGGLALFLGIVFFVKLSIERGWISAELRTAIGFITGLALVGYGVWLNTRKAYAVLGQTLCATGVVVLYGMTFAAHAYYRFPVFREQWVAFSLMSLITTAAFLLAVRMPAQVVAVLGMLGGFLTPILCSTGRDQPFGLFSYIALLDIGVLAVAKHRRWLHLTTLAAVGTIFMQSGWFLRFFHQEGYPYGSKTWIAVAVFLTFAVLFAAAAWWTRKQDDVDQHPALSALLTCGSAMVAAFVFLAYGSIAERPALLYGFVLAINLVTMAIAWKEPRVNLAPVVTGLATFAHLAMWTMGRLTPEMLPQGLAVYLVFGLLHTAYGVLWQRRKDSPMKLDIAWMPVATLVLMLLPVLHFEKVSLLLWPALLVVNLGIIGLALLSRALLPVFSALVLTLFTTLCWLLHLPVTSSTSLTQFLCVLGGFGIVFAVASCILSRRVTGSGNADSTQSELARWLPVSSAVLPFALLIMAMLHLRVANPSSVFGLALLFNLFLLGLSRITRITALPMAGLVCTLALEAVWHLHSFDPQRPVLPLLWYLGFHALFTLHPHLFRRQLEETATPWATAAVAGAGTFALVYALVDRTWPNEVMGLLPLAFAVPQLLSLMSVLKLHRAANPARVAQIAWFGGMSLFFITLIFPIQFEKQWITVSWALEGAALCWLFCRVPHPGLRATGAALLVVAFVRLALNPAVLMYHERGSIPIWNWQLYTYGITALALFFAAWRLAPPRHLLGDLNLRAIFSSLGGILLFLLLNIEIADAFTPPGSRAIAFDFSENLARDMTYSIAWGLFALILMSIGFALRSRHTRYAGIGLLGVTLLKLFFHDLASLDNIYRIGALIMVALIALAASFLYQRFLDRSNEPDQS